MKLMLDTNMLVRICHPTGYQEVKQWLQSMLTRGSESPELFVSALSDYEIRRTLIRRDAKEGLNRLDDLARSVTYLPVGPDAARRAAEISARLSQELRHKISDVDILIVAQAQLEGAALVTSDQSLRAISDVQVKDWNEIET